MRNYSRLKMPVRAATAGRRLADLAVHGWSLGAVALRHVVLRRFLVNPDWAGQSRRKTPAQASVTLRKGNPVYIGIGTIVLIVIIVLVILMLRRR